MAGQLESQVYYDIAQPDPASLVESLRAFGYSLQAAIADIIDNSITANASNIRVHFEWRGSDSVITIIDDGCGMTEEDLVSAMRLGSRGAGYNRSKYDLGKFGLGLKTASFSQCRAFSVYSKAAGDEPAYRSWDLDHVRATAEWRLLKSFNHNAARWAEGAVSDSGTVVLWERLDRVTDGAREDDRGAHKRFLKAIEDTRNHLSVTFHRYLNGAGGINIWVNNAEVKPWDPFLRTEVATQELPSEMLACNGSYVEVVPYILPHHSKSARSAHRVAGGPSGWNAHQGFYIYRNRRLLVAGSWLSLGFQKEEHYKLARIQVDLPVEADSDWKIDVKKSHASPPGYLRDDLRRIARLTRERAVQIYRHRGKVAARKSESPASFVWEHRVHHGHYFYTINREHPMISNLQAHVGIQSVEPLLQLLERTIPVEHMLISMYENPNVLTNAPLGEDGLASMESIYDALYAGLIAQGVSSEEALSKMAAIEPFNTQPILLERLAAKERSD